MSEKTELPDWIDAQQPVDHWFELSYAQFLTVPRAALQQMPIEWQQKMAALLIELDETLDWRPKTGKYWVNLRGADGKLLPSALLEFCDYRRDKVPRKQSNAS